MKAIRRRLTYPRAGFAEERRPSRRRRLVILPIIALVGALAAYALDRLSGIERWSFVLLGIGMWVLLWQIWSRSRLPRFYALGALFGAVGIAIASSAAPFSTSMLAYWIVAAAALSVSGGIAFWRFVNT